VEKNRSRVGAGGTASSHGLVIVFTAQKERPSSVLGPPAEEAITHQPCHTVRTWYGRKQVRRVYARSVSDRKGMALTHCHACKRTLPATIQKNRLRRKRGQSGRAIEGAKAAQTIPHQVSSGHNGPILGQYFPIKSERDKARLSPIKSERDTARWRDGGRRHRVDGQRNDTQRQAHTLTGRQCAGRALGRPKRGAAG
jgi:hypothetical protein